MALPMLLNGADCGPSNPLQSLGKRFDQDRGIQQDQIRTARAGSSKETFRSQYSSDANAGQDEVMARFFADSQSHAPQRFQSPPFDMSALHHNLPAMQSQAPTALQALSQQPVAASWASDFLLQQPSADHAQVNIAMQAGQAQAARVQHAGQIMNNTAGGRAWTPSFSARGMSNTPLFSPPASLPIAHEQRPAIQHDLSLWENEFKSLEHSITSPAATSPESQVARDAARPNDDLALTAALLIDSVQHEENPKFVKSAFMGLMRQLRDGEVVVDGNQMVERTAVNPVHSSANSKGKQRALDPGMSTQLGPQGYMPTLPAALVASIAQSASAAQATMAHLKADEAETSSDATAMDEDPNEAYFRKENEDYSEFWRLMDETADAAQAASTSTPQKEEWGRLQQDWESFEASASGIKELAKYGFQAHNPYLLGESTRHHAMHSGMGSTRQTLFESVLELESAVQRDPTDAQAWFALGVKQQENEREQKAVQALLRALELAPTHLPAYLALAVSHTNEGSRAAAYDSVRAWVARNDTYRDAVRQFEGSEPEKPGVLQTERVQRMVRCLIAMAQSGAGGEVDADLQIALAVLLNISEDWERSGDCFRTALAVRPDDWLLWNRVGATLANSGHAEEALRYYGQALQLNPVYIRARYNMGVALINLRRYQEAAEHLLDALVLQDSDATRDANGVEDKNGVTSSSLWDSLKTTCVHMQRPDLASMCERKDVSGFRDYFEAVAVHERSTGGEGVHPQ